MTSDAPASPTPQLESARLLLIPCTDAHFEAALHHHHTLAALLGVAAAADWPGSPEATEVLAPSRAYLRANPAAQGWWMYLLIHKASQQLIGLGGFKGAPTAAGVVEIGYSLAPAFRGQGLATEAAQALVDFAFRHPEVQLVQAHTLPEHNASGRILQKLGLLHRGAVIDPDDGEVWRWELPRPASPAPPASLLSAALLLTAATVLGSCGSADNAENDRAAAPGAAATELPGKALFLENCALCHGANGKLGVNGAHDLTKSNLNQMGRTYMVTNGLGKMPAFKDQLTPEQIEQVVAYSLTLK
ncbi:GNAT family N-acetyltransferase [Hymenobacter busanensis]|uniref:GNAT family N-acetyltransferase n=1 Tax=Hymenobacter busanensis TaxID=2607656 RepID=A0A7L4ZYF8_9BACT|nr:GNAT family N-acetyltransferase [Hymenobacter busanensis]KAA9333442.1 GNAT family N-acetyltransferase [Hymenobacter busanensis]QHJ07875.1 GNAT family N-acetyltransferase [Hymenobacter busanensis]